MIIGIGIDLVEVGRMEALIGRHPERALGRLFTPAEAAYCRGSRRPAESFAARFAAKEAVFKALGTGWGGGAAWQEIEVSKGSAGPPRLELRGRTAEIARERGVTRTHLSLTHTDHIAAAYVVLEGGDPQVAR
jgi:holo-[acyl-carrier protein] synthase